MNKFQKNLKDRNRLHSKNLERSVLESGVFFMKIERNSHVSQGDRVYFTQSFSNRKISSPSLISDQIHNNFHFHEVSSENNLKTFLGKNKRLKGRLPKCKKYSGRCNQHVYWKNNPIDDISVICFLKKP